MADSAPISTAAFCSAAHVLVNRFGRANGAVLNAGRGRFQSICIGESRTSWKSCNSIAQDAVKLWCIMPWSNTWRPARMPWKLQQTEEGKIKLKSIISRSKLIEDKQWWPNLQVETPMVAKRYSWRLADSLKLWLFSKKTRKPFLSLMLPIDP